MSLDFYLITFFYNESLKSIKVRNIKVNQNINIKKRVRYDI